MNQFASAWRTSIDHELSRQGGGAALNRPLSDDQWVAVLEDGISLDGQPRDDVVSAIAKQVVLWRRAALDEHAIANRRQFVVRRRAGQSEIDWTEEAASDVLAAHAEQETKHHFGVKAFRTDVLGNQLLTLPEVPAWIRCRAEGEKVDRPPAARSPGDRQKVMTLAYAAPGSDLMHRVHVAPGGTLDRLRDMASRLEAFYGWDQAQATTFVLTGMTPLAHVIRGKVTMSSPLLVRSRITLTINPSSTPREVADYYRRVRRQHFGRIRRLGERHARLAAFAAQLSLDLSHADQLRRWNAQCVTWKKRNWQFQHPSRFAAEAQRAVDRLVELGRA